MISNREQGYFRALIDFERDLLPPAPPPETVSDALGAQRGASLPARDAQAVQPSTFQRTSGEGCTAGSCLSQLEPLETV